MPESVRAMQQNESLEQHERQIKQGQERLEHQLAPLLKRPDVFLQPEEKLIDPEQVTDDGPCFEIQVVNIQGAENLGQEELFEIQSLYQNRCLYLTDINQIVAQVSEIYLQQGYVTSRAYIKPQDLSDGSLDILVLEGFAEGLQSKDQTISPLQLELAFPVRTGEILNLRDVEQGIENLNSLSQNQAKADLEPGKAQGASIVAIQNQATKPWQASLGLNNTGVESTGELQLDTSLVYGNLVGINDTWIVSASSNVGEHELPTAKSRSYSLTTNLPLGYWHFTMANNYYEYERTVLGNTVNFLTRGSSLNSRLAASRVLYRGSSDKLGMSLSFNRKESKNYIEDVFLDTSSRVLYVWELDTNYLKHFSFGSANASFKINKSVPWWDAKRELADAEDDFQFTKYQLNLGFNTRFSLFEQDIQYNLSVHALYSRDEILASEGISVGGRYSVRGLSQESLFGFRGGYIRNDFSMPFAIDIPHIVGGQLYLGVDAGASNLPGFPGQNKNWVTGSILGLKISGQYFQIDMSYARALRTPDLIASGQQELDVSIRIQY